ARVTTAGGNVNVVDDNTSTTVFSTATANVQSVDAQGSSAADQQVALDGTLTLPNGVTVGAVTVLQQQGDYDVGAGGYSAQVSQSIFVEAGANQVAAVRRISATSGAITLDANQGTP